MSTDTLLNSRLEAVKKLESIYKNIVNLDDAINVTSTSDSERCSFPYAVTPFRQIVTKTLLESELGLKIDKFTFNEELDCSGSKDGVCIIQKTLEVSNSHAGTHADQPAYTS
jgi:hypothetical protein